LQRYDLAALDLKDVVQRDRAAWEISRHPARHDDLPVPRGYGERFDRMMILFTGLDPPCFDCGNAFDAPAPLAHRGVVGEASVDGRCVVRVLRREVGMEGHWQFDAHGLSLSRSLGFAVAQEERCA